MKKIILFSMALCIVFSLSACSKNDDDKKTTTKATTTTTTTVSTTLSTTTTNSENEPVIENAFEGVTVDNVFETTDVTYEFDKRKNQAYNGLYNIPHKKEIVPIRYSEMNYVKTDDLENFYYIFYGKDRENNNENGTVIVDVLNQKTIQPDYDVIYVYDRCVYVTKDGKYGVLDNNLEVICDYIYDLPVKYYDSDGNYAIADYDGELLHHYHKELVRLYDKDNNLLIDKYYIIIRKENNLLCCCERLHGGKIDVYSAEFEYIKTVDSLPLYDKNLGLYEFYDREAFERYYVDESLNELYRFEADNPPTLLDNGTLYHNGKVLSKDFEILAETEFVVMNSFDVADEPFYFGYTINNDGVVSYYDRSGEAVFQFETSEYYLERPDGVIKVVVKEADGWHIYDEKGNSLVEDKIDSNYIYIGTDSTCVKFKNTEGERFSFEF